MIPPRRSLPCLQQPRGSDSWRAPPHACGSPVAAAFASAREHRSRSTAPAGNGWRSRDRAPPACQVILGRRNGPLESPVKFCLAPWCHHKTSCSPCGLTLPKSSNLTVSLDLAVFVIIVRSVRPILQEPHDRAPQTPRGQRYRTPTALGICAATR
jgi:hypothetical protein